PAHRAQLLLRFARAERARAVRRPCRRGGDLCGSVRRDRRIPGGDSGGATLANGRWTGVRGRAARSAPRVSRGVPSARSGGPLVQGNRRGGVGADRHRDVALVAGAHATARFAGRAAEGDGMTCAEASQLIGPWVDNELDVRSATELEGHVARCPECKRERDELLTLGNTAREQLPMDDLSPQLEQRLWKSVRDAATPDRPPSAGTASRAGRRAGSSTVWCPTCRTPRSTSSSRCCARLRRRLTARKRLHSTAMDAEVDVAIVGGGVVGCAAASSVARAGRSVLLLEGGPRLAEGVTSRNSGVIHSGLYYAPGGLKARTCVRGNALLYEWVRARGVPHAKTGKLVVARDAPEVADLEAL